MSVQKNHTVTIEAAPTYLFHRSGMKNQDSHAEYGCLLRVPKDLIPFYSVFEVFIINVVSSSTRCVRVTILLLLKKRTDATMTKLRVRRSNGAEGFFDARKEESRGNDGRASIYKGVTLIGQRCVLQRGAAPPSWRSILRGWSS